MEKCKDIFPEGSEELQKFERIDQHNIKRLCVGNPKSINLSTIDKMCKAFNCEVSDLFIREE